MRAVSTAANPLPTSTVPTTPPSAESRSRGWLFFLVRLADNPANVVCLALALNALIQPYLGFTHDSRLYAIHVAERVAPGSFGHDLYLQYGSQDRYTVFTPLVAPLVAVLGLYPAFFLVYLASKALLFWGAVRLLRIVLRDRLAVLFSLAFLAAVPVPFGGNEVFHLNESFLTPRLASCGLVLLALERVLTRRPLQGVAAFVGAFLLHPPMAVGGALAAVLWAVARRLSARALVGLAPLLAVAAGFVLWYEPLGARLFGHMDRDWHEAILAICFFVNPAHWLASDWLRLAVGLAVVVGAARALGGDRARFLLAVACTALVGFLAQVSAVVMGYRLVLRTSPYRAVWLMEFLCVPLLLLAAVRLWRRGTPAGRAAALGLLLAVPTAWAGITPGFAVLTAAVFAVTVLIWRGLERVPRRPDWVWPAALRTFVVAVVLLTVASLQRIGILLFTKPDIDLAVHPLVILLAVGGMVYKLPLLLLGGVGTRSLAGSLGTGTAFRVALLGLWAGYQAVLTAVDRSPWYGEHFSANYRRNRFVASYVETKSARGPATVYWPTNLHAIWFGAWANSYFNLVQLSGLAFNRDTAAEGRRRGALVSRFEFDAFRKDPQSGSTFWVTALMKFCHSESADVEPTADDLVRLCRDPLLDVVVLEREFEGLYAATDGKLYVYDCAQVRGLTRSE
jgi:hypothetical protein